MNSPITQFPVNLSGWLEPLPQSVNNHSSGFALEDRPFFAMDMTSNSMSPLLKITDTFLAQKIKEPHFKCGDILLLRINNHLFAHRFLKILNGTTIITKGDNLPQADAPLDKSAVLAKIRFIKKLGYPIDLCQIHWQITNLLLGRLGIIETTDTHHMLRKPMISLLKTAIRILNPSYKKLFSDHSMENKLITFLSRIAPDPDKIAILNGLSAETLDWHYFYKLILYNNIGPIVYKNIKRLTNSFIPEWVKENLSKIYNVNATANARIFDDISQLLAFCQEHNIPIILLKGLSLAQELYNDLNVRPMKDADILVKESDWPVFKNILDALGFKNKNELDLLKLHQLSQTPMHWHLSYANDTGTELEIKFYLYDLDFPNFLDPNQYWQDAKSLEIKNQKTLKLSDEDEFLYLAVRMFNVRFQYLLWFNELREFLNKRKNFDWPAFVVRAKHKNVSALAYFTLNILKESFEVDVPQGILKELRPSGFKIFLLNLICAKNLTGIRHPAQRESSSKIFDLMIFILLRVKPTMQSVANILRYAFRLAFPPIAYVIYRYNIPRWQIYLGWGFIKRIFVRGY